MVLFVYNILVVGSLQKYYSLTGPYFDVYDSIKLIHNIDLTDNGSILSIGTS